MNVSVVDGNKLQNVLAKVLIFDIETLPYEGRFWGLWNQNINSDDIIKEMSIVTWAAKWLFDDSIYYMKATPKEAVGRNDKRLVDGLWRLLDEADVVIAHNLDGFDKKVAQARFFRHGLKLPSPYQTIDTLAVARRMFGNKLGSNRLDHLAQKVLGIDGKMETPKGLWRECCNGSKDAISTMNIYCQQDIKVLEDVYFALRPYIQPHPNIALISNLETPSCPSCGSDKLVELNKPYRTYVNEFVSFRCDCCGSISRARKSNTPLKVRQNLLVSTPK
jgi:hypothetical protein